MLTTTRHSRPRVSSTIGLAGALIALMVCLGLVFHSHLADIRTTSEGAERPAFVAASISSKVADISSSSSDANGVNGMNGMNGVSRGAQLCADFETSCALTSLLLTKFIAVRDSRDNTGEQGPPLHQLHTPRTSLTAAPVVQLFPVALRI